MHIVPFIDTANTCLVLITVGAFGITCLTVIAQTIGMRWLVGLHMCCIILRTRIHHALIRLRSFMVSQSLSVSLIIGLILKLLSDNFLLTTPNKFIIMKQLIVILLLLGCFILGSFIGAAIIKINYYLAVAAFINLWIVIPLVIISEYKRTFHPNG